MPTPRSRTDMGDGTTCGWLGNVMPSRRHELQTTARLGRDLSAGRQDAAVGPVRTCPPHRPVIHKNMRAYPHYDGHKRQPQPPQSRGLWLSLVAGATQSGLESMARMARIS